MSDHPSGTYYRIAQPIAPILAEPDNAAMRTSEALYGESLEILSRHGQWCQVRLLKDHYEGFVAADQLQAEATVNSLPSSHRVASRSTLLFSQADLKSQLLHRLPFGAELTLTDVAGTPFSQTACGYHVWTSHCLPLSECHPLTPLQLAQQVFLGTPYLWGGRSPEGIDCSGLVQALAHSQGLSIPRDSGDQERFLQTDVSADDYQPQDLVYWPGHTGILVSPSDILHATAHSLSCVIEPLQAVVDRAGPVRSVKRLFA